MIPNYFYRDIEPRWIKKTTKIIILLFFGNIQGFSILNKYKMIFF